MQKGGSVEAAASSLNAEGTWDQLVYGSLSDIEAGEKRLHGSFCDRVEQL